MAIRIYDKSGYGDSIACLNPRLFFFCCSDFERGAPGGAGGAGRGGILDVIDPSCKKTGAGIFKRMGKYVEI